MRPHEPDAPQDNTEPASPDRGIVLPGASRAVFVTWLLLAANILIWLLMQLIGGFPNQDPSILLRFGAIFGPLIATGEYWRLFTAMFLHANILHLLFNCFGLYIFGKLVESVYGSFRFTIIYLLAGLSSSALSYFFNKTAISVGASGAIFGIIGAFAAYFLSNRTALGEMGRRNLTGLIIIAALNLGIGIIIPNIDNWAHLGGLAGGFILGLALAPRYRFESIPTPFGIATRISGQAPLRAKWLAVPAFIAAIIALVWLGGLDVSNAEQSQILVIRAETSLQQNDPMQALDHAERAIELDPRNASAFYIRGKTMAQIGSTDRALSDLSAALRLPGLDPARRQEAISLLVSLR